MSRQAAENQRSSVGRSPPERRLTKVTDKAEGLRERKKRATRQLISNIATGLFTERGFENVTIDDVAAAASVSKMTVFNYFPRQGSCSELGASPSGRRCAPNG